MQFFSISTAADSFLSQDTLDHMAGHICKSVITSIVMVDKSFIIQYHTTISSPPRGTRPSLGYMESAIAMLQINLALPLRERLDWRVELDYLWTALAAYFVGSIPTGYLLAKARGVDIRSTGSGNIGATNVFRVLGKAAGITVLLIDALKGFIPAYFFHFGTTTPENREIHSLVAGLFAILGHNYTCWLRFKGGKGIATSAGVLLALTPKGFLIVLAVWIIVFAISKYVSLASIIAAAALPAGVYFTGGSKRIVLLTTFLSILAIYKHKANINRLMNGTENRFGKKKQP